MAGSLLDSNFFIQSYHFIPMDIFPSFWKEIGNLLKSGEAIVHETVFAELKKHEDELAPWIKGLEIEPMETSLDCISKYVELCEWARSSDTYTENAKRTFTDSGRADAWLCAEAFASGFGLVSYEVKSNSTNKIKIPNVCELLGVSCLGGFDYMRKQGFCF